MRSVFLGAIGLGLLAGVGIVGFRAATDGGADAAPGATATSEPSSTATTFTPEATADAFAAAWSAGDYAALHALLTPQAQLTLPLVEFEDAYRTFARETTQSSLAAETASVSQGEASVSVALATRYFDTLRYTVTLSLVETPQGFRVAWTPDALYPELQHGYRLVSELEKPRRGAILDRNGAILAETRSVETMALNRSIISDRDELVGALLELDFTQPQIDAALASPLAANQRVSVGPIPQDLIERAVQLERTVDGLLIFFETSRVHPLGPAAAHVVGYTRELTAEELGGRLGAGYSVGDRIGATGIEAAMDATLAGSPGGDLRIEDANANVVRVLATREVVPARDVTTTLDAGLLQATQARLGDQAGSAVVMAPGTNEILALNSNPSFDPDAFERGDSAAIAEIFEQEGNPLLNRATGGVYSAGSVFKLITGSAGFIHGVVTTTDRLDCSAIWTVVDPPRRNWEGAQGFLTVAEGLMRSCNPVFYQIGYDLSLATDNGLSQVARLYGFGSSTGTVGLADEAGLVPDAEWKLAARGEQWFVGDDVNLAIGQGDLLMTPLQLANAYTAFLAGELRTPVIVQGASPEGRGEIPLTAEQHAHLLNGLKLVTGSGGTAAWAYANQGYFDFGGKSGTAEDAGEQQHVLFVAFSPADAPEALAAVVLDEGFSGSIQVGPIARDLVLEAMNR